MEFYKKIDKPIGQILMERGVITSSQLQQVLEIKDSQGKMIGEIIVEMGFAKKKDIVECLSTQLGQSLEIHQKPAKTHKKVDKPLGQILVERGVITPSQLKEALEAQKRGKKMIGEIIVEMGFAKEEDIAYCLSLQFGYPYLPLENYEISPEIVKLIPKKICIYYCLIPIDKIGNTLTVAMANPLNVQAVEDMEDITNCGVQIFISTPTDIKERIEKFY